MIKLSKPKRRKQFVKSEEFPVNVSVLKLFSHGVYCYTDIHDTDVTSNINFR